MKKRFTEEQIIKILEEAKTGLKVEELCRKYGISQPTYYNWKSKFEGMTVSDAKKLRNLEAENSKLKRLVADLSLDNVALKDALTRKW
jgi:putative transposase